MGVMAMATWRWEIPAGDSQGEGKGASSLHPVRQSGVLPRLKEGEKSLPSVPAPVFWAALLRQHHLSLDSQS